MESSKDLRELARKSLKVAEQMLIRTYPIVHDPKLILAVAGDVYIALASSMKAVLIAKKEEKDLAFDDTFASQFEVFQAISPDFGFTEEETRLIAQIHTIIQAHKQSPVEFARKDKFVICDEKYNCNVISVDDMKSYLFKAGLFIEKADTLMGKEMI